MLSIKAYVRLISHFDVENVSKSRKTVNLIGVSHLSVPT